MAKPIEVTNWATSGSALRTATDSSRWNLGWQTLPGNLPTDTGERPNLNQQNYWQFAVHQWLTFFDTQVPDPSLVTIEDLWRWEASDIPAVTNRSNPFLDAIGPNTSLLEWRYTEASQTFDWETQKADTFQAARYYELIDMLSNGMGIQIVDANDVIWTVIPTGDGTGQDIANNGTTHVNMSEMATTDAGNGNTGLTTVDLNPGATGNALFTIRKDDGGTVTTPAGFTGFGTLNNVNFPIKNPNGVRVVLVGSTELAYGTRVRAADASDPYKYGSTRRPARRWIRTVDTSDEVVSCEESLSASPTQPLTAPTGGSGSSLHVTLIRGRDYRVTMMCDPQSVFTGAAAYNDNYLFYNADSVVGGSTNLIKKIPAMREGTTGLIDTVFEFTAMRTDKLCVQGPFDAVRFDPPGFGRQRILKANWSHFTIEEL